MPAAWLVALLLALSMALTGHAAQADTLRVGSKRFTESYILGEILTQTASAAHGEARHLQGLGNTAIVFEAIKAGSIDLYPDYTGTLASEILKLPLGATLAQINLALAPMGLAAAIPLGFENTYAIAVSEARGRDVATLSDLARHPAMRLGLSHEFLGRVDGWPGLARRYGLPQRPAGIDHGIAYEALAQGQIDATDIYSTDAKIRRFHLRVLEDNLHFFPRYDAVVVYRLDVPRRYPGMWQALEGLAGKIRVADMIDMNAAAEIDGQSFVAVARQFLAGNLQGNPNAMSNANPGTNPGASANAESKGANAQAIPADARRGGLAATLFSADTWRLTVRHVALVMGAVGVATLIGVPLGIVAARRRRLGQVVLATVSVLQTVPSLALLAMLIPLLGRIGVWPAMVALFLYALLPIVRNTCTGLQQVSGGMRDAARALGFRSMQVLRYVEVPLAMPIVLAGIKTAAIISVGTATIAAFVGAGGFGERIATGLALNDSTQLLAGAIPAAVLALVVQAGFGLLEMFWGRERHA
ncbi:osmoprotectant transport system permease protein [Cupriavidus sp. YR651]|uniref:ABC transporter permease/substrate-binding protein n=1 Tax=Cupriavidus sp. YR651 TaxID=1855315 RepID=UPI00089130D4|nr:osmoprotectant transport system permease protein [Cupriavidus sp. YR651]